MDNRSLKYLIFSQSGVPVCLYVYKVLSFITYKVHWLKVWFKTCHISAEETSATTQNDASESWGDKHFAT